MDSKLKKIVEEGRKLIKEVSDNDNPKRKILLNRATKSINSFEIVMNKLLG